MRRFSGLCILVLCWCVSACGGCEDGASSRWDLDDDIGTNADAGADGFVVTDDIGVQPDLSVPATCGDGVVDDGEVCDGAALNGRSCEAFGFPGGELGCMDSCAGFVVGDCTGIPSWTPTREHPCEACGTNEVCMTEGSPRDTMCVPKCTGPALVDGSQLDTDVRTHAVSATVTIGGESIGEWVRGGNLGVVIFRPQGGPDTEFNLDQTGRFDGEVFEGTYNVYWSGRLDRPSLPLLLASEVHIDRERQFDFDAQPPELVAISLQAPGWFGEFSGVVRVHFASDWAPRRYERFDLEMSSEHSLQFYLGEPVELVLDSIESSRFEGASGDYRADAGPLPFTVSGRIAEQPDAPIVLPVHQLTVEVPPSGDAPDHEHIDVRVSTKKFPSQANVESFINREVDYGASVTIPVFSGDYWLISEEFWPRGRRQVSIDADTTEVIEPEAHWINAEVDLSSIDFGEADGVNYSLLHPKYRRQDGSGYHDPADRKSFNVPEGAYDIEVETSRDGGRIARWRANDVQLSDGAVASPTFVERQTVTLRGEILRRGETMPDNTYSRSSQPDAEPASRGRVRFLCIDDCFDAAFDSLSATGPAFYEVELEPGVYRVEVLTPNGSDWNLPTPQDVLPVPGYVLHPRLEVGESARRDFDIRMDRVDVTVREDGATLSPLSSWPSWLRDEHSQRGSVSISRTGQPSVGGFTFAPFGESLGSDGEAQATFYAYPGYYTVGFGLSGIGSKRQALALRDDAQVSFDISLAHLSGTLTWNGQRWSEAPTGDGGLAYYQPYLLHRDSHLASDGSFGVSLFAEPTEMLWRRLRAYNHQVKLGQFTIFDGCPARR